MTLYGVLIKSHRVDGALAREAVDNHHMTRPEFRDLFSKIFDKPLSRTVSEKRVDAETKPTKAQRGEDVRYLPQCGP